MKFIRMNIPPLKRGGVFITGYDLLHIILRKSLLRGWLSVVDKTLLPKSGFSA